jgi:hypothetical protein
MNLRGPSRFFLHAVIYFYVVSSLILFKLYKSTGTVRNKCLMQGNKNVLSSQTLETVYICCPLCQGTTYVGK